MAKDAARKIDDKPKKKTKRKAPKKIGRPSKCTKEVQDRFLQAIRLGCPIKDACGCAWIAEPTYYRWMDHADIPEKKYQIYRDFREKVKEVEGEATRSWLAVIEKAAREGTWQAAAWKLERRRNMFIPKVRQEVTGKDGDAIQIKKEAAEARTIIESAIAGYSATGTTTEDFVEVDPTTTH